MFRYVAILWPSHDHGASNLVAAMSEKLKYSTERWECVLSVDGMTVFVTGRTSASGVISLSDQGGVIVGTLFTRVKESTDLPSKRLLSLSESASQRILSTAGRALVDEYWGRYVAFLRSDGGASRFVIRAPVSQLPCHLTRVGGVDILYSWLPDCSWLTRVRFNVDWHQLAVRLGTGWDRWHTSLLKEATTVYPGQCLEFSGSIPVRKFYWHPEQVASTGVLEDLPTAARELDLASQACIPAWASCYPALLHRLSGGFDSSVVGVFMELAAPRRALPI